MLSFLVDDEAVSFLEEIDVDALERQIARMLGAAALSESLPELSFDLRITTDEEIRNLNRDYRKKDKATDVLAFSQREGIGGELSPEILGDVVISVETAEAQAKEGLSKEVLFLAAHGLCHLLGYDHGDDEEEREMNERMQALLSVAAGRGPIVSA